MNASEWATIIIGLIGALSGGGALITAVVQRGRTRAEATQIITGSAVTLMTEFEEDAKAARAEARQVREEMAQVRAEARALADELHRLRRAIMRPGVTVNDLRTLVSGSSASLRGRTY